MQYCTKTKILIFIIGVVCLFSCQNETTDFVENPVKAYSDTIAANTAVDALYATGFHSFIFRQTKNMVFPWHGEAICPDCLKVKLRKVITLHW